jgi:hypothetical protein
MKITLGVGKVNGNDAVFLLADSTTVLSLHAGSFDSFFDKTGFVDDADGMFASMFFGNDFLYLVPHFPVIPLLVGEEPLNGSDGNVGLECDGFAIFPGQVRGETVGVKAEIVPGVFVGGAGFEPPKQVSQIRPYVVNCEPVHDYVLSEPKRLEKHSL